MNIIRGWLSAKTTAGPRSQDLIAGFIKKKSVIVSVEECAMGSVSNRNSSFRLQNQQS